MPETNALQPLVCPKCHGNVASHTEGVFCEACGNLYPRHPDGFLDLRRDGRRYHDWISTSDEATAHWMKLGATTEATGAHHMMRSYLIPLLHRLGLNKGASVLSVGCGGGWDVEELHANGYQAWGVDNGGRIVVWKNNASIDFLSLGDALSLPYGNASFDFVFAEGVIEHIGYAGDVSQPVPDWQNQRRQFCSELLRVTKPGGYILVACPNRLFPIDFFHGGKVVHGFNLRFHSPRERFLLSFSDIKNLFPEEVAWMKPLSLKNFFNLQRLKSDSRWMTLPIVAMDALFGFLPPIFWRSALTPYVVVLVKRQPHGA